MDCPLLVGDASHATPLQIDDLDQAACTVIVGADPELGFELAGRLVGVCVRSRSAQGEAKTRASKVFFRLDRVLQQHCMQEKEK